jgi:hypothetical protein
MADNFLQFSETLDALTPEEADWLRHQLEPITVINGTEYPEDDDAVRSRDTDPSYQGMRFLRDYEDREDGDNDPGFETEFQDTDVWFSAEAHGNADRLAHLIQKFLKKFRPDQCWSLTYATTCSKLRVGEFGGGAVFVTADKIRWRNAYDFVEQQRAAFQRHGKPHPGETNHGETAATEP